MNKITPNQIILFGGGSSIQEGMKKNLREKIKGKCVLGINWAFKFIDPTATVFIDHDTFYKKEEENIKKLPLLLGDYKRFKVYENTMLFMASPSKYYIDLKKGIYKNIITGIYTLSIANYLLGNQEDTDIFLLGYDYGQVTKEVDENKRYVTHFYQGEIEHRGIGKVSYYSDRTRRKGDFDKFNIPERKPNIYNVSLNSNIEGLQKISYDTFFQLLDDKVYDQDILREEIKEIMKPVEVKVKKEKLS